jgi:hypothetical protein
VPGDDAPARFRLDAITLAGILGDRDNVHQVEVGRRIAYRLQGNGLPGGVPVRRAILVRASDNEARSALRTANLFAEEITADAQR